LQYAQSKLTEEEARAKLYLDNGPNFKSVENVMDTCVEVFVVAFKDQILAEFPKLLEEDAKEYLKLTHELVHRVKGCNGEANPLLPILEEYICNMGSTELKDNAVIISKDASKYVSTLMDLYNRNSSIIEECFQNEFSFLTIRDKAYQRLVNDTTIFSLTMPDSTRAATKRPESRCPTLLAAYTDMLLRKSPISRRLSQEEILSRLKNVLLVLKYVNSKDLFLESHKAHLMRRLILETSADTEMEGVMVEKLREAGMPAELVNRLARMFTDIKMSRDLTRKFQETFSPSSVSSFAITPDASSSPGPIVNLKILSCGTWLPRDLPRVSVALPPELEDYIPQIEDFYQANHKGRQLIWQYHLCHAILAYYPPNQPADEATNGVLPIELEVTILQLAVLLAWRYRDITHKLRLDDLATATAMVDSELRRTIWSLAERPKTEQQVILYTPAAQSEKDFTNETEFWINPEFGVIRSNRAPNRRRINMIGRLQLSQSNCDVDGEDVVRFRQLRLQEATVRLMKSRKRSTYSEMYQQVVGLIKHQFIPSKRMFKEVIEWLIERRYLERDSKDIDTFTYVT
uniref:Cullin-5 n=1 Tax=Rodentolepis nana TaxID=102285 RepID=A0A158QJJ6_RODNA